MSITNVATNSIAIKSAQRLFAKEIGLGNREVYFLLVIFHLQEKSKFFVYPKSILEHKEGYCISAVYESIKSLTSHNLIEVARKGHRFKISTLYNVAGKGRRAIQRYLEIYNEVTENLLITSIVKN
jgi:predicted MarR family transcription regulator